MGDIDIDLARDRDKWRTFGFYKIRELCSMEIDVSEPLSFFRTLTLMSLLTRNIYLPSYCSEWDMD